MQQHGQFEIERSGQMMICRPSGTFNLARAAYEAHFARELTELVVHPSGFVEVATDFEAAGPEVLTRFLRQFDWWAQNSCLFLAVVLSGGIQALSVRSNLQRLAVSGGALFRAGGGRHSLAGAGAIALRSE